MSDPAELFTDSQINIALIQWLEYGEQSYVEDKPLNAPGQAGYFSGNGWAARCLRFHLDQRKNTRPASQPAVEASELQQFQPCGCQVCICNTVIKCGGCGAKNCGKPDCVLKGDRRNALYVQPTDHAAPQAGGEESCICDGLTRNACPIHGLKPADPKAGSAGVEESQHVARTILGLLTEPSTRGKVKAVAAEIQRAIDAATAKLREEKEAAEARANAAEEEKWKLLTKFTQIHHLTNFEDVRDEVEKVRDVVTERDTLRAANAVLTQQVDALTREVEKWKSTAKEIDAEHEKTLRRKTELFNDLASTRAQLEEAKKALYDAGASRDGYRAQVASLTAERDAERLGHQATLDVWHNACEEAKRLESDLAAARQELERLNTNLGAIYHASGEAIHGAPSPIDAFRMLKQELEQARRERDESQEAHELDLAAIHLAATGVHPADTEGVARHEVLEAVQAVAKEKADALKALESERKARVAAEDRIQRREHEWQGVHAHVCRLATDRGEERDEARKELAQAKREKSAAETRAGVLAKALEAAGRLMQNDYTQWQSAGGPDECPHGFASGIACRKCDEASVKEALATAQPEGKQ